MKKKIVIVTMILMIVTMSIGYSIFSSNLTIKGTANIASTWNILFTKIEEVDKKGSVTELTPPAVNGTNATFSVDFKTPGDYIIYQITVENKGTIDAVVKEISASETGSDGVYFKINGIKKGDKLPSKSSQIITVEIGYSSEVTSQPGDLKNNLTLSATFEQDGGGNIPSEDLNIEGPVLTQVTGESNITLDNSSGRSLNNYIIYGNSIQNGIPAPDNPLPIQSFGENNIITIENLLNNNKTTIDLTGHEPLRKVGNSSDYIDFINKRIVRNVGMYEFTGDEEWGCYKTAAENSKSVNCFIPRMFFAELVGEKTDKRNSNKLSTHFPFTYLGQGDCNYRDGNGIYYNSTQPFMITTNKVKDVNEWKSYLEEQASKKTPLTIIYELEKSIYEPISLPNIGTKVGTNNFTIESNIPPSQVTLQYYKK